ncbi:MAG: glycosyltransferase family 4 protein [Calditrichaeota bacterium]|nr:glycosyltransferase family 4 protein [Calditrichota bacterium]
MKILHITDITSVHAVRWIGDTIKRGHDVTVLSVSPGTLEGSRVIYLDPGDKPAPMWLRAFRYLIFLIKEWLLVKTGGFDIVHVHYLRADQIGYVATMHPRCLISVWGSDVRPVADGGDTRRVELRKKTLEAAARILAVNSFLEDIVRSFAPAVKKIEVVPFGIEMEKYNGKPYRSRGLNETWFCYAKLRLADYYGPDLAIKALSIVVEHCPGARLAMLGYGDTEYTEQLKSLINKHNLEKYIKFFGVLNSEDLISFIAQNDVLLQPSRWESFGVVVLEAAALSKPSIATRVGGVSEIVINGETGITVPSEDVEALAEAMIQLTENTELRRSYGENAREFVRGLYDFNMHAARVNDLYHEMLNGKQS